MNILTDSEWAEWRLNPVTQEFFRYLRTKKYATSILRHQMTRSNEAQMNGFDLAKINGIDDALSGLLSLDLKTMVDENKAGNDMRKQYKEILKEDFGVEYEHL